MKRGGNTTLIRAMFFLCALALFSLSGIRSGAGQVRGDRDDLSAPKVAVFAETGRGIELDAIAGEAAGAVAEEFNRCGRFRAPEAAEAEKALGAIAAGGGKIDYRGAAERLKCGLMAVISVSRGMRKIYAVMTVTALDRKYSGLQGEYRFESMVPLNVPLKLARETAYLHRNMPLEASVLDVAAGKAVLNAGQWHGLTPGTYRTAGGETVRIVSTSRYRSVAVTERPAEKGDSIVIASHPDVRGEARRLDNLMRQAVEKKYRIESAEGSPEELFMTSLCIQNLPAGTCVPGYGSFLAARNLTRGDDPSAAGIAASLVMVTAHLTLTEFMTGFDTNFFPWVRDSDKTRQVQRLHIFLWASLPLTVSVSYMDQMAHSLSLSSRVPPFFISGDETAAALSLFIPGGGLFYKGHRLMGWGYYLAEMGLAGLGVYRPGSGNAHLYAFAVLGAVKALELAHAYFAPFGYDYCREEMDRASFVPELTMGVEPDTVGLIYRAGVSVRF